MKDKRESFNSRWGFILACIGSAVGMGNIWMFPTRVSLEGTEKHTIFILTLIKKKKSIRVFMILVDFLLDKI